MSAIEQSDVPWDLQDLVSAEFWKWYRLHKDVYVTTISFWIIKKRICVEDLHDIFTLLFGPDRDPSQSA